MTREGVRLVPSWRLRPGRACPGHPRRTGPQGAPDGCSPLRERSGRLTAWVPGTGPGMRRESVSLIPSSSRRAGRACPGHPRRTGPQGAPDGCGPLRDRSGRGTAWVPGTGPGMTRGSVRTTAQATDMPQRSRETDALGRMLSQLLPAILALLRDFSLTLRTASEPCRRTAHGVPCCMTSMTSCGLPVARNGLTSRAAWPASWVRRRRGRPARGGEG